MAKDVLITPGDALIQFSSSAGTGSGQILADDNNNLVISNLVGDVLLGDGASDVFIGDGTNNVDIVFEQNGEIRDDTTGKSITLGSKTTNIFITGSSTIAMQKDGGNVGIGTTSAGESLEVIGNISGSGNLKVDQILFNGPRANESNNIKFEGLTQLSSSKVAGLQWDFPSDDAYLYAHQSSSDVTNFVFEQRDNTTSDNFTFWFNDYKGSGSDSFPLHIVGDKFVVNYLYDRKITYHKDSHNQTNMPANNVDFYLLKSGSTTVSEANSLIFGDVSAAEVTINGNTSASGFISASSFAGDGAGLTNVTSTVDIDGLGALGGTGVAQSDKFLFSDAGTEKSITFSNLEDAIFGNVSGEATIAAGGALTIAANSIGNNELKQDDDITLQSLTTTGNISGSLTSTGSFGHGFFDSKVGIGTTSPSELLHICGSGDVKIKLEADSDNSGEGDNPEILFSQDGGAVTGMIGFTSDNDFKISNEYNNDEGDIFFKTRDTERMRLQGNGRLGIGTGSASTLLHIKQSITNNSDNSLMTIQGDVSDLGTEKVLIDFTMTDTNANNYPQVKIGAAVGQDGDADSQAKEGSGAFVVYTSPGSSTSDGEDNTAERMRVNYLGHIGINTTTPSNALHISTGSGNNLTPALRLNKLVDDDGSDGGTATGILMGSVSAGSAKTGIFSENAGDGNGRQNLIFAMDTTADTSDANLSDERMRITHDGKVGIGTTDPTEELQVTGDISASGTIKGGTLDAAAVSDTLAAAIVAEIDNDEIPIAKLASDAITIAGTSTALGGSITSKAILVDGKDTVSGSFTTLSSSLAGRTTTVEGNVGTTTNALTVDNATLQLNSGTTFNGSAAKTISVKDGGIDSDALAADITVESVIISKGVDGGNTLLTISNTNTDSGLDKGAGIEFKHSNTTAEQNAGLIIAGKDTSYGAAFGTAAQDSNLQFFTTLNGTNTEAFRIKSNNDLAFAGNFNMLDESGEQFFVKDSNLKVTIGDSGGSANSTVLSIDDNNNKVTVTGDAPQVVIGGATAVANQELTVIGEVSASSTIASNTGFVGHIQATGSYDFPGAIMGYNVQGLNVTHASYTLTTSYAVPDAGMHVVFVAPKSGIVEIEVQFKLDMGFSAGTIFYLALSDADSYNSVASYYEQSVCDPDENDDVAICHKWVVPSLTAGTTYQYWMGAKVSSTSGTPKLQWGGNASNRNTDFIMKATALPSNTEIET